MIFVMYFLVKIAFLFVSCSVQEAISPRKAVMTPITGYTHHEIHYSAVGFAHRDIQR